MVARRIASAGLAAVLMWSGPLGLVATAAAERASVSIHPLPAPATLRAREAFGKPTCAATCSCRAPAATFA